MTQDREEWKQIAGYEGMYDVSNKGRVRSYHKFGNGRRDEPKPLKPHLNRYGYPEVTLCKETTHKQCVIHRLVAGAFLGNPDGLPQIDHINGIKTDNRVENLEYVTPRENTIRAAKLGLKPSGEKHGMHKLTRENVEEMRRLYESGYYSQRELGKMFGVSHTVVGDIVRYKTWRGSK